MKLHNIAIESDVFEHLIEKVAESGKNISTVIRDSLGINMQSIPQRAHSPSEFDALFTSTEFRYAKGVVGKFLAVLSWLYRKHQSEFDLVENIRGRGRLYFAKGPEPLKATGNSVNPKQIPHSPFWVITTSPTILKQETLGNVMKALGYSQVEIQKAQHAIAED